MLPPEFPLNSPSSSSLLTRKSCRVGGGSQCITPTAPPLSCLILPQCPTSPSNTPLITYSLYNKTQEIIQLVHSTHTHCQQSQPARISLKHCTLAFKSSHNRIIVLQIEAVDLHSSVLIYLLLVLSLRGPRL